MGMKPPLFAPTPHIVATLWTPKKIFTSSCRRKLLYVKVDILSVGDFNARIHYVREGDSDVCDLT